MFSRFQLNESNIKVNKKIKMIYLENDWRITFTTVLFSNLELS